MIRRVFRGLLGVVLLATFAARVSGGDRVTVAAAANLVHVLDALHAEFRRTEPGVVVATTGASGTLVAQIRNGAPFDVFLSADTDYPRALVTAGAGDAASVRTFATGQLVAWTTRDSLDLSDLARLVRSPAVKRIAIAQPATAPYGRAAQAALEALGAWTEVSGKCVFGENIAQTAQFVETGNADLGFVALSLVRAPQASAKGKWVEVPAALHARISLDHAAVLTRAGAENAAARRYLAFLGSDAARALFTRFGYRVPAR